MAKRKKARPPSVNGDGEFGLASGWFKASRHEDGLELLKENPNAFILAYIIARRAQWRDGFNPRGLEAGEAHLGDHANYGLSEQQYRTAKLTLEKGGFATFRPTTKGTVARLMDSRLFSVVPLGANGQAKGESTDGSTNGSTTTKNQRAKNKDREEGRVREAHSSSSSDAIRYEVPTEEQVSDYAAQEGLDDGAAEQFWQDHERDGWTIRGKRICWWRKALDAFNETYEASNGR